MSVDSRVAPNRGRILVTGATSQIGQCLLVRLAARGFAVTSASRSPISAADGPGAWRVLDLSRELPEEVPDGESVLIHLAPLPLLPAHLDAMGRKGIERLIAFGSTSRYSKSESGSAAERVMAARLAESEDALARSCDGAGVAWTLFRPTMIYGLGLDQNVSVIASFIVRFRFFPLVHDGRGLRQPVHADDLAKACVEALDNPRTYRQAYDLAGGEVLSYRQMVERVFGALGITPRFLRLSPQVLRGMLRVAAWLPRWRHLTPQMVDRMNQDLCFDSSAAVRDFGYSPRGFQPPASPRRRDVPIQLGK